MCLEEEEKEKGRMKNLAAEGDDGVVGGVDEDAAVTEGHERSLDFEDDVAVNVGDHEVAVGDAHHLLHHRQIHRVRSAELRPDHGGRHRRHRGGGCGLRRIIRVWLCHV